MAANTYSQDMMARGAAHTALRAELHRQGPLHAWERDLLLEAADALLFSEDGAEDRLADALALLGGLELNERRTSFEAYRLRIKLQACAETPAAPAPTAPPSTEGLLAAA
jgi:hypothetical protein